MAATSSPSWLLKLCHPSGKYIRGNLSGKVETIRWYLGTSKAEKCFQAMSEFYMKTFGENWWTILAGLKHEKSQCAMLNCFSSDSEEMENQLRQKGADQVFLTGYMDINQEEGHMNNFNKKHGIRIYKPKKETFDPPHLHLDPHGRNGYYLLDMSSLIPALALEVQPSDFVLDMCAAPGGKSLAIAMQMSGNWQLIANEYDVGRRKRLYKVFKDYIPKQTSKNIKVTNMNGILFGKHEPNTFDRILLDAPCSSDRHLIQDDYRQAGWSIKKSREFAKLQKELLLSALHAVRVGGVVVYSTCTLSPIENDEVIERGLYEASQRHGIETEIIDISSSVEAFGVNEFCLNDTAKHGVLVLPTPVQSWGPMYTSKLLRIS